MRFLYVGVRITGLSDRPPSQAIESQREDLPRSDKSGLSSNRRREALGIPAPSGQLRNHTNSIEQGRPGVS